MTLILTRASHRYVMQVTDRLVTGYHDPLANKNIVCLTHNAIITMGYTGLAAVNGVPIDQWMVQKLTGIDFGPVSRARPEGMRRPPLAGTCPTALRSDVHRVLLRLKDALEHDLWMESPAASRNWWYANEFDVTWAGWQWYTGGRYRPIIGALSKARNGCSVELHREKRSWHFGATVCLYAAPSQNLADGQLGALMKQLEGKTPDEVESHLVSTVRDVARRLPLVGPNCMSILILPPTRSRVRVRYVPTSSARGLLISKPWDANQPEISSELMIAFSPWLIGPSGFMAPAVIAGGGLEYQLGSYTVQVEAPDNPGMPHGASSQLRPSFPR